MQVFSELFENWPAAVVYPRSVAEVQAVISCARQARVRVHPRCGSHGNEGESVQTGDVTMDLANMTRVELAADGHTVRVQAGARVGQVIASLWRQSNGTLTYPGGQRPVVGISGYTLGEGAAGAWQQQHFAARTALTNDLTTNACMQAAASGC